MEKKKSDRITVLLVDDEKELVDDMQYMLTDLGMKVYVAYSGTEGYSKACNLKVDVIVTDYRMPIMNGGQFFNLIKSSRIVSQIPILFYTGSVEEAKAQIGESPLTRFLSKPVNPDVLAENIYQLQNEKRIRLSQVREVDAQILGAFIGATKDIFKSMLKLTQCDAGRPFPATDLKSINRHVSTILHISTDQFKGAVLMSFPHETLLPLSARVIDHGQTTVNSEVADCAGELMNIVWGQTKAKLAPYKYTFHAAVPTVIMGNDNSNISLSEGPTVIVPLHTDLGSFSLVFFMAADIKAPQVKKAA